MVRHLMKSKIHRATITSTDLHDEGSLTLDRTLMAAADELDAHRPAVLSVDGRHGSVRPPLSMDT